MGVIRRLFALKLYAPTTFLDDFSSGLNRAGQSRPPFRLSLPNNGMPGWTAFLHHVHRIFPKAGQHGALLGFVRIDDDASIF